MTQFDVKIGPPTEVGNYLWWPQFRPSPKKNAIFDPHFVLNKISISDENFGSWRSF